MIWPLPLVRMCCDRVAGVPLYPVAPPGAGNELACIVVPDCAPSMRAQLFPITHASACPLTSIMPQPHQAARLAAKAAVRMVLTVFMVQRVLVQRSCRHQTFRSRARKSFASGANDLRSSCKRCRFLAIGAIPLHRPQFSCNRCVYTGLYITVRCLERGSVA